MTSACCVNMINECFLPTLNQMGQKMWHYSRTEARHTLQWPLCHTFPNISFPWKVICSDQHGPWIYHKVSILWRYLKSLSTMSVLVPWFTWNIIFISRHQYTHWYAIKSWVKLKYEKICHKTAIGACALYIAVLLEPQIFHTYLV